MSKADSTRRPWLRIVASALFTLGLVSACGETTMDPMDDPDPTPSNAAPVAAAGTDATVSAGLPIQLDGSASTDGDGDALTFAWTLASAPGGSAAALDGSTTATPTLVPDVAGAYTVQLVVNDGTDDSAADDVVVTAEDNTSEAMVGAGGGAVTSTDGGLELMIPAGALSADTEIRITTVPPSQFPPYLASVASADLTLYDLKPDGLEFDMPVEIRLHGVVGRTDGAEGFGAELPFLFTVSDGDDGPEGERVADIAILASADDPAPTATGTLTHFSTMVALKIGIDVEARGVPTEAIVEEPFDVTVRVVATAEGENLLSNAPTQTDGSDAPLSPEPGFDTQIPLTGGSAIATATNSYVCQSVGGATFRTEVDVTYEIEPDPLEFLVNLFGPLAGGFEMNSTVTLSQSVTCATAPSPPPAAFEPITREVAEGFAVLVSNIEGTAYVVAHETGVTVFDDNGSVLDEFGTEGAGALVGAAGTTNSEGEVRLIGFGTPGVFGVDPLAAGVMDRLMIDWPQVTDGEGSTTDGMFIPMVPGSEGPGRAPAEGLAGGQVVLSQFEDRNVAFLRDAAGGGLEVVPELADAFAPGGVSIFGADRPISVWVGPDGFDEQHPMLVVTIADNTVGALNVVTLENGVAVLNPVTDFSALIEPRRVRCDDATGVCGVSSFRTQSFGGIYAFQWDGQQGITELSSRLSFAPVGIDVVNTGDAVLMVGTDTDRFVNGAFQNEYRVIEYSLTGNRVRDAAFLVPEGCVEPFHALFRRRIPEFNQVLISCAGDETTPGGVFASTFEWPTS